MSRYAAVHASPKGPGDARPIAEQVIKDEGLEGKLNDLTVLITGGTAGLGTESARVLSKNGAKVFITARSAEKGEKIARELSNAAPNSPPVEYVVMDLSNLASVRAAATEFLSRSNKLNVLMTNAGVMACPEARTADGFELQFGTNHLAHFLLFQLLKPLLLASATPARASRVVALSSGAHRMSDIHPKNYNLEHGEYEPWKAYGQSKTANVLMANEIDRRYSSEGLHGMSLHPGIIYETEIARHQTGPGREAFEKMKADETMSAYSKNTEQGAATQVWGAVAPELEGKGGVYLDDVGVADEAPGSAPGIPGYVPYVMDEQNAKTLWRDSNKMLGLAEDE